MHRAVWTPLRRLFGLDAGSLCELPQHVDFAAGRSGHRGRAVADRRAQAKLEHALRELGRAQHLDGRGVQALDDGSRRFRRCQKTVLQPKVVAFQAARLADRRRVGQLGCALRRGQSQRAQPALLDERERHGNADDADLDVAGGEVCGRRRTALVRNMVQLDRAELHQELDGEMAGATLAE